MKLTQTTEPTSSGLETKRKKEFALEAWEKETSNEISLKNINNNKKAALSSLQSLSRVQFFVTP